MVDSDTPTAVCGVCTAPTPQGIYLCKTHLEQLADELTAIPDGHTDDGRPLPGLAADLQVTITRQSRAASQPGRAAERPLAWNERASIAAVELNAQMNAWAYETATLGEDERDPQAAIHTSNASDLARWLWRNLATAQRLDNAGDMHREILDAITEARRAVDKPVEPSPFGTCGNNLDDGTECPEFLYGYPNRPTVTCTACTAQHSVTERMRWMQDHCANLHGTPTQLVPWLLVFNINTTREAIRQMANRGRLTRSNPGDDHPRYKLTDAITAFTTGKHKRRAA